MSIKYFKRHSYLYCCHEKYGLPMYLTYTRVSKICIDSLIDLANKFHSAFSAYVIYTIKNKIAIRDGILFNNQFTFVKYF